MMAVYRANPDAFGGNINILRHGSVLRIPGADEIAALNQNEAISEVHRQMSAVERRERGSAAAVTCAWWPRLPAAVQPGGGDATSAAKAEAQALKDRVKDLEGQLAESNRLIDIRNSELSALQRKLGVPATPPLRRRRSSRRRPPRRQRSSGAAPRRRRRPPAATATGRCNDRRPPLPPPVEALAAATVPAPPVPKKPAVAPVESGSWIDWVAAIWWMPAAVIVALILLLVIAARRRRQVGATTCSRFGQTPTSPITAIRPPSSPPRARANDSFVVEESGEHPVPEFDAEPGRLGDTHRTSQSPDDTMSSESAVNLDQGDPLAEADFHMAYGLYDQAADLVRIALEREPDRRDLRLKLLEIYFVWGNKDAFLQTAKGLEATRDRAPAGEWDKIVIMGKQICPDEPMFAATAGSGRGAGALVDLNLEGGENRVDIDLFGEPEGERSTAGSLDWPRKATTRRRPANHRPCTPVPTSRLHPRCAGARRRFADSESPTREMPPRDEPTVESEMMNFGDANSPHATVNAPALKTDGDAGADPTASPLEAAVEGGSDRGSVHRRSWAWIWISWSETGSPSISRRSAKKPIIRPMRRPWWPVSTSVAAHDGGSGETARATAI